jgi:NAD(P)-dependent dehydrogenase (short-subunit alcohol dehydrogenase family)
MELKGKVVVVAGVGPGLGSAVVSLVAGAGATTVAIARSSSSLDKLAGIGRDRGWTLRPVQADLASPAEVGRAIASTVAEFGRIDGVSLNTGRWIQGDTLLHKTTDAEWSQGISENLDAIFQIGRAVLPHMVERRSGSLDIVSAADRVRHNGNVSYCVAKGGLVDLTLKLAHDYRPYGVRVNAVLPGTMEHEIDPASPPDPARPLGLRDESGSGAWEVARSIGYLLSDDSRWTTGALLTVDGGYSLRGKEQPPEIPR